MRPDEIDQQPSAQGTIAELRRLRGEYPDAQISTELVRFDEAIVVVRAAIALPNGGSATGFGATAAGGPAAIENAEVRALGRALALLGFGAIADAPLRDAPERPTAARPAPVNPREPAPATRPEPAAIARPEHAPVAPFVPEITREPVKLHEEPEPEPVAPTPPPARAQTPPPRPAVAASTEDDIALADYSWTEFWKWSRAAGYANKPAVEELIGQSITSLNPAQVRSLMRAKAGID